MRPWPNKSQNSLVFDFCNNLLKKKKRINQHFHMIAILINNDWYYVLIPIPGTL